MCSGLSPSPGHGAKHLFSCQFVCYKILRISEMRARNALLAVTAGLASAVLLFFGTAVAPNLAIALVRTGSSARDRAAPPRQQRLPPRFHGVVNRRIESVELLYPCNGASAAA